MFDRVLQRFIAFLGSSFPRDKTAVRVSGSEGWPRKNRRSEWIVKRAGGRAPAAVLVILTLRIRGLHFAGGTRVPHTEPQ